MNLSDNDLTETSGEKLVEAVHLNRRIKKISLSGNAIGYHMRKKIDS